MKFADLINKQNTTMGLTDSPLLRLRNASLTVSARSLIDGVVNTSQQRIGDAAFIKTGSGPIDLYHFGIGKKGSSGALFCFF